MPSHKEDRKPIQLTHFFSALISDSEVYWVPMGTRRTNLICPTSRSQGFRYPTPFQRTQSTRHYPYLCEIKSRSTQSSTMNRLIFRIVHQALNLDPLSLRFRDFSLVCLVGRCRMFSRIFLATKKGFDKYCLRSQSYWIARVGRVVSKEIFDSWDPYPKRIRWGDEEN